jgi:M6 family metalloprotease-like protein
MHNRIARLPLLIFALSACIVSSRVSSARAATAEDFGYGTMTVNGTPAMGTIPLLVALFDLSTNGGMRRPLIQNASNVFHQLVFNFFSIPSVNGYFLENSYGSFSWQRAGVIGPVSLDANETATLDSRQALDPDGVTRTGLDSRAGIAYLVERIAAKTGYNFAQWDDSRDGFVDQQELSLMVIGNNGQTSGANRQIGSGGQLIAGQNVTVRGRVASLDHRASFMTFVHELSHSMGTIDLYGNNCWSSGLSLMTCTIYAATDDRRTFHLDPWHKMRLGWLRPRIFTLAGGGIATLAASHIESQNTPVILYDPGRGTSEYLMVEFRNNQVEAGHHDINLTDSSSPTPFTGAASGMAVWHIAPGAPQVYHEGATTLVAGGSALWNQITPVLRWRDGTATITRLNPLGTISEGRELVFEWLTASETWVDFQYGGFFEFGTFENPFDTVIEGHNAAARGGRVRIKSGSTTERPTLTKPLTLEAFGGPVRIGP